jgi:hypothetical protein
MFIWSGELFGVLKRGLKLMIRGLEYKKEGNSWGCRLKKGGKSKEIECIYT